MAGRCWIFVGWLPSEVDGGALAQGCRLLNAHEVFAARQPSGTHWKNFPPVELALTLPDFDVDCFSCETYTFVSERLRKALRLPPHAVQYFDVDAGSSSARVRENNYKIMNVASLEDAVDTASSSLVMGRLTPSSPEMVMSHGDLVFADCTPRYEMFHDRVVRGHVFCSDALALRVLVAGCTGVRFFDPTRYRFARPNVFRTVRGVEREDWNADTDALETRLVEPIDAVQGSEHDHRQ